LGTSYNKESNAGNAGDIDIRARQITLAQGGQVFSGTQGPGNGGTMTIRAEDSMSISGVSKAGSTVSGVYGSSESTAADSGQGGTIVISTPRLILSDEGRISTSGWGGGSAGDIALEITCLKLDKDAVLSSESRSPENGGAAGTIVIAKEINISQNDDGSIRIDPAEPGNSVRLSNNSVISTDSESSGGGKIVIYAKDTLYLSDSRISTSVSQGSDKGGDIAIGSNAEQTGPMFVVLKGSRVQANADEGDGGAIFIVTRNYLKSSDSVTEVTSRRGNEGSVKVVAPDTDIISGLTVLPANFSDADQQMKTECENRSGEGVSRFRIRDRDALPTAPDDCQASPLPGMGRDRKKGK
jgi:large exoprotein involved in heme utilization and adhesion